MSRAAIPSEQGLSRLLAEAEDRPFRLPTQGYLSVHYGYVFSGTNADSIASWTAEHHPGQLKVRDGRLYSLTDGEYVEVQPGSVIEYRGGHLLDGSAYNTFEVSDFDSARFRRAEIRPEPSVRPLGKVTSLWGHEGLGG